MQHLVYTQAGRPKGSGADVFTYKESGVRNLSEIRSILEKSQRHASWAVGRGGGGEGN